jgi:DnaD/phage-associated family protein
MSLSINLGAWNSVFAVPCSVVDNHLKLVGAVQLKVLLWVLRHAGETFETKDIADALGIERADVDDAMSYWQEVGLVSIDGNSISPAPANSIAEPAPFKPENAQQEMEPEHDHLHETHRILSRPEKPDSEFVAKRMAESKEISCLMQSAQEVLGRLISEGDAATLLLIHDNYGLPSDVIIMLMQYAANIGKGNMRYIEKVAMSWADEGIVTHEKVEEKLRILTENQKAWHTVESAIGISHRTPSKREETYAPVWINEWKFSPEMIREAYDRTVDGTGKYQTGYMNRILERWHKEGIATPKQAAEEQTERNSAKKTGMSKNEQTTVKSKPTFDIDEYERTSIYDTKR